MFPPVDERLGHINLLTSILCWLRVSNLRPHLTAERWRGRRWMLNRAVITHRGLLAASTETGVSQKHAVQRADRPGEELQASPARVSFSLLPGSLSQGLSAMADKQNLTTGLLQAWLLTRKHHVEKSSVFLRKAVFLLRSDFNGGSKCLLD